MKLLNQSIKYLSIYILLIVSIWAVIFYVNMLDEIYDSIDDGLNNYKLLIIQKVDSDSSVLNKNAFDESNYAIQKITKQDAVLIKDTYIDTLLYMPYEKDLEPVRLLSTAFEYKGNFFQLKVISSMVEEDDLIEDLFWSIFWLYLILVVSIIIINNVVLQKLWKPFYNILNQLKTFRLDNNNKLSDVNTKTKEFNELKNAANTLIEHSLETYANQKQFIENAAHELQTPLAIATNKLELLLEQNDLKNSTVASVAEILQIVERLTRLNKSLLLLSKIENKQYFDNQTISINKVVHQCMEDLRDYTEYKNIAVTIIEPVTLEYSMDAMLAHILIFNLIKNAILYNVPNGSLDIVITKNTIKICNTGKGDILNTDKVFNRFHKDSSEQNSTGLGLAITRAVCKLYGFDILYSFDQSKHCFEIHFKN